MKKIKWSILSLAVIFSITAAFATKPHFDCATLPQYYFTGQVYLPVAGSYACMQGGTTCTFYTTNGGISYSPCTTGVYNGCPGCAVSPKASTTSAVNSANSAVPTH